MSISDTVRAATGTWDGTNRLYLPGEPLRDVPSSAVIVLAAQGQFSMMSYTWSFDGQPQDGLLLIGEADDRRTTVVWIDSWHMGDKVMVCVGQTKPDSFISVRGAYHVENAPDWGWRIELLLARDVVRIEMYNVSPEGDESLAVEAFYTRSTPNPAIPA